MVSPQQLHTLQGAAEAARERAYAPYSQFFVGAALTGEDGRQFTGCNVENASYGLSICAERVALTTAVAAGIRKIAALAVAGPEDFFAPPCGACRQFLAEFATAETIVAFRGAQGWQSATAAELLPHGFKLH